MTDASDSLAVGLPLRVALVAAVLVTIVMGAINVRRAVTADPRRPDLVDFHEIDLAGRLALEGRLAEAYDPGRMARLQRDVGGRDVFLPFGYPPPFALLLAPLARIPLVPAFLLFDGATLALFLAVLRRLARAWFWPALLATSPAVLIDLAIGQNGLLTAGLAGLSVAILLERRDLAGGVVAGALGAIKPHLAVALPLILLLRRNSTGLAAAILANAALWGLATALFGPSSVAAFVRSLDFTGRFMAAGAFPLHRMASVYASALSFGLPPAAALALQGVVALAGVGAAIAVARHLADGRAAAGLLLAATAVVSPYFYDYDLTVFGVGLALVLPALTRRVAARRAAVLLVAVAGAEALGLLQSGLSAVLATTGRALIGPAMLVCYAAILMPLARAGRSSDGASGVPAPETAR